MCTVSFKVDENVKTQAQELFDELFCVIDLWSILICTDRNKLSNNHIKK